MTKVFISSLDLAVGRIKKVDFPMEYAKISLDLSLERFLRGLNQHPEFSRRLSDYDRSALWKSNCQCAAALAACKVLYDSKHF